MSRRLPRVCLTPWAGQCVNEIRGSPVRWRKGEYVNYLWPRWDGYFWPRIIGLARCLSVKRAQRRVRPSRLGRPWG